MSPDAAGSGAGPVDLAAALRTAATVLAAAGVPSPRADAELLAAHLLGVSRGRVRALAITGADAPAGLEDLVGERARRIPLQHLTGNASFRTVELAVGPGVFVPRPETESVVQVALDRLRAAGLSTPRVADLGTGSGAIAAAVAAEVPGAIVVAVERSELALAWAQRNLAGTGVELVAGDFRSALAGREGTFDVVITNPPYVPPDAVPVDPEVAEHDPPEALYGGERGGLEHPAAAAVAAAAALRPGGFLVMEHAEQQGPGVERILAQAGFTGIAGHPDLTGRRRATSGVLPGGRTPEATPTTSNGETRA
ncbi:release factor glutamine methyltransferase [Tersicoccus solisilvae]|uniref:Release factor glutamine methyltransferase n=1 Tax=Tersicoccus solisilvae TaxID=1882339 RepID=A0ABQ1P746_9MICC|nr:peptide chain release factor N(5)-glutamine methyltransferase [Tersicoccus solisilvae]GGC92149.1 release factor glutamine methyltransferase [Tersicoccus solisilvae]